MKIDGSGSHVPARLTPVLRTRYLLRGAVLWLGIRLALAFAELVYLGPPEVLFLLVAVAGAVWADQRVRHEDVFLANLGVAPWPGPVLSATAAGVLETVARVALGGSP